MRNIDSRLKFAAILFALALFVRLALLFTLFSHLQHGSAGPYGSAALGIHHGSGLTVNLTEVQVLRDISSNLQGDFTTKYFGEPRSTLTEFLPGPAIMLAGFWKLFHTYNFSPYIIAQAFLDSIFIALVGFFLAQKSWILAVSTAGIMVVNLPTIRRTLMMGYDFWPQFAVLVLFVGALALDRYRYRAWLFFLIGLLSSIPIWCRDITTPLPFFLAAFLIYILRVRERVTWSIIAGKTMLFLGPVLLSISLLAQYRYETTENYRPTRSTFWHSFMAGVGQFSNPYGIVHNDLSVWEFAKKTDPRLQNESLAEMYLMPNSPYELILKDVAYGFIVEHTTIFIRNAIYRAGIIISPLLYRDGDFMPKSLSTILYPVGLLLLPVWGAGMLYLKRRLPYVFGITITIYIYFLAAFSWFYVVGRVVLPILFINVMVWICGLIWIRDVIYQRRKIFGYGNR